MKRIIILLSLLAASSAANAADTWSIDTRHTSVNFSVRNFFSQVPGSFKVASGQIVFDAANLSASSVETVIAVGSVNTQEPDRDKHLNSQDFFLVEKFPTATFKSTKWESAGENKFKVTGDLTIKDVTKSVTLDVALLGTGPGNRGRTISGWEATTRINRKDWGVSFGGSIGDEVAITINLQAVKQEPAPEAKQG